MTVRLTPAQREMLEFIAGGKEQGRMHIQIVGSGGRSAWTLAQLRTYGLVEANYDIPTSQPDFYRATAAGRALLGEKP